MKDGPMISNRKIAKRLKISENCVRNTLKALKTIGGIQRHAGSEKLKKNNHGNLNLGWYLFRQIRTNPSLSYREFTNTLNENREKRLSSNTVRNILLRKKIGVMQLLENPK